MTTEDDTTDAMSDPVMEYDRPDRAALVPQAGLGDHRTALYARLRTIIDNATESIRALKEENATLAARNGEMSERVGTLEYRIRAVTSELANDELALRRSAEELEQLLNSPSGSATPHEPAARPTPLRASESEMAQPAPPVDPSAETGPIEMMPPDNGEMDAPENEMAQPEAEAEAETESATPEMEASETPPVDHTTETVEMVIPPAHAAASADGSYTLIAYPFVRFSDLGQFQAALQKLAGVHDVQVRRFAQGTLEMRIGYTGAADLATTLRTLETEVEDVQEEEPTRLRVRLRTSQDA